MQHLTLRLAWFASDESSGGLDSAALHAQIGQLRELL
jgi:hypothetical protein